MPYGCRNGANFGGYLCYFAYSRTIESGRSYVAEGVAFCYSLVFIINALSILCRFHSFIGVFTSCGEDGDDPFFCLIPLSTYHLITKRIQTLTVQRLDKNHNLSLLFITLHQLITTPTILKPYNP